MPSSTVPCDRHDDDRPADAGAGDIADKPQSTQTPPQNQARSRNPSCR